MAYKEIGDDFFIPYYKPSNMSTERMIEIYKNLFSDLIESCSDYISVEDLTLIGIGDRELPLNIVKQEIGIHFTQTNDAPIGQDFFKNAFGQDKADPLDFLISLDLLNKIENVAPIIERIGIAIKSKGVFAFTYERINNEIDNSHSPASLEFGDDNLISYPVKDGVIQRLLISNDFYIQHEVDYKMNAYIDIVLIVAQKK